MKTIVNTPEAPAPIGPYSQAVTFGNTLYTSGQIAIDPQTSKLVSGTIEEETERVMQNLKAVVDAAGYSMENIVKCTIFIKDMNDFGSINSIYGSYFNDETAPARETVEVARLPKDVRVEISCIAVK